MKQDCLRYVRLKLKRWLFGRNVPVCCGDGICKAWITEDQCVGRCAVDYLLRRKTIFNCPCIHGLMKRVGGFFNHNKPTEGEE